METPNLNSPQNIHDIERTMDTVIVGRHLEDIDDLSLGTDTQLKSISSEGLKSLDQDAEFVIADSEIKRLKRILVVSSPLRRSYSTSILLKARIKSIKPDFSVRIKKDDRFSELSHGEIILPYDYKPGKRIEFLKDAWNVFWSETFTEDGNYNNPNYRFGDPILLQDGKYKHPEIYGRFSSYGESYRELCERYYGAILDYLENRKRVEQLGVNVVLVAHSATLAILKELECVSGNLNMNLNTINTGDLMKTCWQAYLKRISSETAQIDFGEFRSIALNQINDRIISYLRKELDYIKNPENYAKKDKKDILN